MSLNHESALKEAKDSNYVFGLYVACATPNSMQAITNIKKICEEYLGGRDRAYLRD
jgi:circadian clock protein KaiB